MESYHEIDTIKLEKQKAMRRYRNFKKIANIVRTLEIVVVITLISYSISFTSSYLPSAVEISGAFFRRLSSLLFSPHFVFLVGNVIIITLFAKSSGEDNSSNNAGDEISGENAGEGISVEAEKFPVETPAVAPVAEGGESEEKVYRRTKSTSEMVVLKKAEEEEEEKKKELRRSETEVRRKIKKAPVIMNRRFEADELSNEEFRRKVEAFIEKQQKALREEKLAVVLSN